MAAAAAATTKAKADAEAEAEAAATTKAKADAEAEAGAICAALVIIILAIVGLVHLCIDFAHIFRHLQHDPVQYSIAIANVTGLNPAKDLLAGLLDPAFNLTLLVVSPRTAEGRECVKPGTTVEVSYLRSGVLLATGPAPTFCVDVGKSREEGSIIAWGDGVRLPELLLDSLAADMRHGAPGFGVKLTPASDCGGGDRFC